MEELDIKFQGLEVVEVALQILRAAGEAGIPLQVTTAEAATEPSLLGTQEGVTVADVNTGNTGTWQVLLGIPGKEVSNGSAAYVAQTLGLRRKMGRVEIYWSPKGSSWELVQHYRKS